MAKRNINSLMKNYVLGVASEEERSELFSRADIQEIDYIMDSSDLCERYEMYEGVDEEKAFLEMMERINVESRKNDTTTQSRSRSMHIVISRWMRYVAMALIVFVAASVVWWHMEGKREPIVALPESRVKVTEEMQSIMNRAKEVGKAEATIALLGKAEQEQIADECGLSTEELLEAQKITTVQNREYWVRLCDGSMVHINGGTRLIYPEHFYGHTRDIYIEGEAYFMVAEDKDHPFVVHTPHGNVKELGTEFNVNTRKIAVGKEIEQTEVVLVKGSIAVSVSGSEVEYVMSPGDMAVMTHDGKIGMGKVDVAPYVAWNTGMFSFMDKSLEDVMDIVGKWYGKDIIFADQKLRNTLITGTFDRYESIENILSGIGKSTGLDIQLKGSRIIVEE